MTTSTSPTHLGRTRRLTVIALAGATAFLGLGAVAGAATDNGTHAGGSPTPGATPTGTTTTSAPLP